MRRGGLFLKYAIPLVILVSGALIVSGMVGLYFSYQESKAALARVQHEKALAAAIRIEQFVRELEHQLAWVAQTPWGPRAVPIDQRRLDSLRLLRQAPTITEVSHIDPTGHEQLRVSRLGAVDIGDADVLRLGFGIVEEAVVQEAAGQDFREERELRIVVDALGLLAITLERRGAEKVAGLDQSAGDRSRHCVRLEFSQANTPAVVV